MSRKHLVNSVSGQSQLWYGVKSQTLTVNADVAQGLTWH
jgi:hypothetical protein